VNFAIPMNVLIFLPGRKIKKDALASSASFNPNASKFSGKCPEPKRFKEDAKNRLTLGACRKFFIQS